MTYFTSILSLYAYKQKSTQFYFEIVKTFASQKIRRIMTVFIAHKGKSAVIVPVKLLLHELHLHEHSKFAATFANKIAY